MLFFLNVFVGFFFFCLFTPVFFANLLPVGFWLPQKSRGRKGLFFEVIMCVKLGVDLGIPQPATWSSVQHTVLWKEVINEL